MLAISVSRLNLNLDEELREALSYSPPASASDPADSADAHYGPTHSAAANCFARAGPVRSGEGSAVSGQNPDERKRLRPARSSAVYPNATVISRKKSNNIRRQSLTAAETTTRPPSDDTRTTVVSSSLALHTPPTGDPSIRPASLFARRLSSPLCSSRFDSDSSQSAPTQAIAAGAFEIARRQKLDGELELDAEQRRPHELVLMPEESAEGLRCSKERQKMTSERKISPVGQRTFSIVEEREHEDEDDADVEQNVDMFHDMNASAGAGVSASASAKGSEAEESEPAISFTAGSCHSSLVNDAADRSQSQSACSTVHKKATRETETGEDRRDREVRDEEPEERSGAATIATLEGLVKGADDANYRFSLDSFAGGPPHYAIVEAPRERTDAPDRAENLTRRQHSYLFQSTFFAGMRVLLFLLATGKLLQWLEESAEWDEVHTLEETRAEFGQTLWEALVGRRCGAHPAGTNASSAFTARPDGAGADAGVGRSERASGLPGGGTLCESVREDFEKEVASWMAKFEESVEHTLRHKYARDYDHLHWTFANAVYVMWTAVTTIGFGHMAPATKFGRVFVVAVSLLGVPMFMDLATRFANEFLAVCNAIRAFLLPHKHLLVAVEQLRRHRDHSRDIAASELGDGSGGPNANASSHQYVAPRHVRGAAVPKREAGAVGVEMDECPRAERHFRIQRKQQPKQSERPRMPLWMVCSVVPAFTALLAALYMASESASSGGGWSFIDAVYFTFITLSTIGFGDMVPSGPMWATLLLIVPSSLGVGLYALCFESIQLNKLRFYRWLLARLRLKQLLQMIIVLGRVRTVRTTLEPASSLSFLRNRQQHCFSNSMLFSRPSIREKENCFNSDDSNATGAQSPPHSSSSSDSTEEQDAPPDEQDEQSKYERWYRQYYNRNDRRAAKTNVS